MYISAGKRPAKTLLCKFHFLENVALARKTMNQQQIEIYGQKSEVLSISRHINLTYFIQKYCQKRKTSSLFHK